jgi:hypothetical protein
MVKLILSQPPPFSPMDVPVMDLRTLPLVNVNAIKASQVLIVRSLYVTQLVLPVRENVLVESVYVKSVTVALLARFLFAPLIAGTMAFALLDNVAAIQDIVGVTVGLTLPQPLLEMGNPQNYAH